MVPRRKNIDVLAAAIHVQHPEWSSMTCLTEAKLVWDKLYLQQRDIAQVRANRLKKPFMLISTDSGGVDVVAGEKRLDEGVAVYLIVTPQYRGNIHVFA